jgi:hypothetical protein
MRDNKGKFTKNKTEETNEAADGIDQMNGGRWFDRPPTMKIILFMAFLSWIVTMFSPAMRDEFAVQMVRLYCPGTPPDRDFPADNGAPKQAAKTAHPGGKKDN